MAVQVAQEPAAPRFTLHMAQEAGELLVGHMVSDLAADDEIERLGLVGIVAGPIVYRDTLRRVRRRCGTCYAFALRVEVHPTSRASIPRRAAQRATVRSRSP